MDLFDVLRDFAFNLCLVDSFLKDLKEFKKLRQRCEEAENQFHFRSGILESASNFLALKREKNLIQYMILPFWKAAIA